MVSHKRSSILCPSLAYQVILVLILTRKKKRLMLTFFNRKLPTKFSYLSVGATWPSKKKNASPTRTRGPTYQHVCGNRSSWSLSSTFSALPSWIHSFLFCFQLLSYCLLPAPAPSPSSLPLVVAGALLILDPNLIWLQVVLCLVHHFSFGW